MPAVWITSDDLWCQPGGMPNIPHGRVPLDPPDFSDDDGRFELKKSLTLRNVANPVPLIAVDESAERMALSFLSPSELRDEQRLVLTPICKVRGTFRLEGVTISATLADENGREFGGVQFKSEPTADGLVAGFQVRLPVGSYTLAARPSSHYPRFSTPITIAAGQGELDLGTIAVRHRGRSR